MLQRLFFLFLCVFSFFIGPFAEASLFHIEPVLGHRQETLKLRTLTGTESELKASGLSYGLNIGLSTPAGISVDVSGLQMNVKAQPSPSWPNEEKPDFLHTTAALQIGVSAIGLLKIYLGYGPYSQLQVSSISPLSSYTMKGSLYQVGLATQLFSKLSLGIQYNVHQFKKISGAAYTQNSDPKTYFDKIDTQDILAYLSYSF